MKDIIDDASSVLGLKQIHDGKYQFPKVGTSKYGQNMGNQIGAIASKQGGEDGKSSQL